jgi:hypothetical protein
MKLAALALLALTGASVTPSASGAVLDHVRSVDDKVAAQIPRSRAAAATVEVVERAAASARVADGRLTVSTGLLAILRSDAQLAMILATERARAASRAERDRESLAVDEAMRALLAAGYDGREAAGAWDRIASATPLAANDGGTDFSDVRANRERTRAAQRALARSGERAGSGRTGRTTDSRTGRTTDTRAGRTTGAETYREGVLAQLEGWRFLAAPEAGRPRESPPTTTPAPLPPETPRASGGAREWLSYARSGGITGWTVELRVGEDGTTWSRESHRKDAAGSRRTLTASELAELRSLVERSLAAPPRAARPELKYLRDGFQRSLEVRAGETTRSLQLSEGYSLTDSDHLLVRFLEDLLKDH